MTVGTLPMRLPCWSAWLMITIAMLSACSPATAQAKEAEDAVKVNVDTTQVADQPELVRWAAQAKKLIEEWHPRISNLLLSKGFDPPFEITFVIKKQKKGVGHTTGQTITIMSGWIDKHPDDWGLVIHELTHVIQRYRKTPAWVTEGVADYVRWAIYEGKPLKSFHCPSIPNGYTKGYRAAAGFLLWLESDLAPGIVSRINSAARDGKFRNDLFSEMTGFSLEQLWDLYRTERGSK